MENLSKKHSQNPHDMADCGLEPKDQLVYVVLRSYANKDLQCWPSQKLIAQKCDICEQTVRACIKRLVEKGYITVERRGRGKMYVFKKLENFEPFSPEFLARKDISFLTKSYLVATQQYMDTYNTEEGIGKLSYTTRELADKINMPQQSIVKCDAELKNKGFLTTVKNNAIDPNEGYTHKRTKFYNLRELDQMVIWKLRDHEERINKNTEDISKLAERIDRLEKENAQIKKENQKLLADKFSKDKTNNEDFNL